jgi:hypothetical protein
VIQATNPRVSGRIFTDKIHAPDFGVMVRKIQSQEGARSPAAHRHRLGPQWCIPQGPRNRVSMLNRASRPIPAEEFEALEPGRPGATPALTPPHSGPGVRARSAVRPPVEAYWFSIQPLQRGDDRDYHRELSMLSSATGIKISTRPGVRGSPSGGGQRNAQLRRSSQERADCAGRDRGIGWRMGKCAKWGR